MYVPLFAGRSGLAMCGHVRTRVYTSDGGRGGWERWLKVYVACVYGLANVYTLLDLALEKLAGQIKLRCVKMIFQIYLQHHICAPVSLFIGFTHVKGPV